MVDTLGPDGLDVLGEGRTNEELKERRELITSLNEAYKQEAKVLRALQQVNKTITTLRKNGAEVDKDLLKRQQDLEKQYGKLDQSVLKSMENLDAQTKALEDSADKVAKLKQGFSALGGALKSASSEMAEFTGYNLEAAMSLKGQRDMAREWMMTIKGLEVEMRRSTGSMNRYIALFEKMRSPFRQLGLTAEELQGTIVSLNRDFAAFRGISNRQQRDLVSMAGRFTQLGVSIESTGKLLQTLFYGYGASITDITSGKAFDRLAQLSQALSVAPEMLVQQMTELGPELSRYGNRAEKIFRRLTKLATNLGLTTKDAFDVSELFDTFDQASNTVGRLNAQFGTQLNTIQLMRADSDERLKILREEFKLRNINPATMTNRRQRQMLADILGTDVMRSLQLSATKAGGIGAGGGGVAGGTAMNVQQAVKEGEEQAKKSLEQMGKTITKAQNISTADIKELRMALVTPLQKIQAASEDQKEITAAIYGGIDYIAQAQEALIQLQASNIKATTQAGVGIGTISAIVTGALALRYYRGGTGGMGSAVSKFGNTRFGRFLGFGDDAAANAAKNVPTRAPAPAPAPAPRGPVLRPGETRTPGGLILPRGSTATPPPGSTTTTSALTSAAKETTKATTQLTKLGQMGRLAGSTLKGMGPIGAAMGVYGGYQEYQQSGNVGNAIAHGVIPALLGGVGFTLGMALGPLGAVAGGALMGGLGSMLAEKLSTRPDPDQEGSMKAANASSIKMKSRQELAKGMRESGYGISNAPAASGGGTTTRGASASGPVVVKELTLPITLAVGKDVFYNNVHTAVDVILNPPAQ